MKTKWIVLWVLLLLSGTWVYGQGQNNVWITGVNAGLDFNTSPVSFYNTGTGYYCEESTGSICDRSGKLLFYCSGGKLYNRSHALMPHSLEGDCSTAQGIAIAPIDDRDSLFFVFSLKSVVSTGKLHYCVVNMHLDGGMGDIDFSYGNGVLLDGLGEQMTFAGKCTHKWLLVHHRDSSRFYAFSIGTTPSLAPPVISNSGMSFGKQSYAVGQMRSSPDSKTIGLSTLQYGAELYDFDVLTGMVGRYRIVDSGMAANYGLEFSADGSKLYASLGDKGMGLYQYDLSAGSPAAIAASKYRIRTERVYGLRRGPDDMIYISWNNMARIRKPDLPGALCDFQAGVFSSVPHGSSFGLGLGINYPWQGDTTFHWSTRELCTDDTITLSGSGYRDYFWSDGSTGAAKKVSGKEAVHQLYSVSGCVVRSDSFVIREYPNSYHTSARDTVLCLPGYIDLAAREGADSVRWNDGSRLRAKRVTSAGLYWVVAYKKCGYDTDTFRVTAKPLIADLLVKDTTFCFVNEAIIAAPDTFSSYTWAEGSNKKDTVVRASGKYLVTARKDSTCKALNIVHNIRLLRPLPTLPDLYTCLPDSVKLDASVPFPDASYEWSTGATTAAINVLPPATRFVFVRIGSCTAVDTVRAAYTPLHVDLGKEQIVCKGTSVTLRSKVDGYRYQWSTGATTPEIEVSESGTYVLKAYNDTCSGSGEVKINFVNCSECAAVPGAFTPNNDGINDRFKPIFNCPVLEYELSVRNRWGQVLFFTNSPNDSWDGTSKGATLEGNVYYYMFRVKFAAQDQKEQLYKGDVTLIR